jgi:ABC-type amino acid transport substrate-binding protein
MLVAQLLALAPFVLRVGYVDNQYPCSYKENEIWKGTAVEVWSSVAQKTNASFVIKPIQTPKQAINQLAKNNIDIAISCFNLTEERLRKVGYTAPYRFEGVKLISQSKEQSAISAVVQAVQKSRLLDSFMILFGTTLIITAAVIMLDRGIIKSTIKADQHGKRTFIRLWLWLTMGGALTDKSPKLKVAAIGAITHYSRIIFSGALIAAITAVTVKREQTQDKTQEITQLENLRGLRVGVIDGSYSEDVMHFAAKKLGQSKPITVVPRESLRILGDELKAGNIDVIAGDASAIELYSEKLNDKMDIIMHPIEFSKTPQGFLTSQQLPKEVDSALDIAVISMMSEAAVGETEDQDPAPAETVKK